MQTEQDINSGNLFILKPRKAPNKAFLKVKAYTPKVELDGPGYALDGLAEEETRIAVRSGGQENSNYPLEDKKYLVKYKIS